MIDDGLLDDQSSAVKKLATGLTTGLDERLERRFRPPDSAVIDILLADVKKSARHAERTQNSQFWRRSYVRSAFAFIEGAIHFLKADALSHHERNLRVMHMIFQAVGKGLKDYPPLLGPGELYALLEETIEIDSHGACRPRALKLSVDRNIRFTFQMLARLYEIPVPDYSKNFVFLKNGSDIRNRITHPKVHNDVDISDAELAIIQKACQWMIDQFSAVILQVCKHLSKRERELISWVHTLDSDELGLVMLLTSPEE